MSKMVAVPASALPRIPGEQKTMHFKALGICFADPENVLKGLAAAIKGLQFSHPCPADLCVLA